MKYLSLPESCRHMQLPFYLAAEEYAARHFLCEPELFFMWQVEPTVIFGRNQLMECEVNLDFCQRESINVFRRKSGGGAVFADMNNIMFSYITDGSDITGIFSHYTSSVARFLRGLGLDASDNSRNDILIGERKVSGNAFYRIGNRCIAHGTMLYDMDARRMCGALTPSSDKLRSKGVESVRSRVTTIREHLDISLDDFMKAARNSLCESEIRLTEKDVQAIDYLSEPYYTDRWIRQHNPRGDFSRRSRIDGVGEFYVDIELNAGKIGKIYISGDFFPIGDFDAELLAPLRGVDYTRDAVEAAIARLDPSKSIPGLDRRSFAELLF